MKSGYPLATTTWDDAEYAAMHRVIESGRFTMGPEVQAFESSFAAWHGSKFAVMVNSGSSANLLMVAALFYRETDPLQPGDESDRTSGIMEHNLCPAQSIWAHDPVGRY